MTTTAPRDPIVAPPPRDGGERPRRTWVVVTTVVALVLTAVALAYWQSDAQDDGGSTPGSTTVPSSTSTTPSSTTEPTPTDQAEATVMWPAAGTVNTFDSPTEVTASFARDFLGFTDPIIGELRQGDSRSGEVPVRPTANGPETTVLVRQVGPGDAWSVVGSTTDEITVVEPAAGTKISSPVTVKGRARAFEGHVDVEVRADGTGPIGSGFVTGGGDVVRPFEGTVPFETPSSRYGAVVFLTRSAMDGRVWEAVAVRVEFDSTDVDAASCGGYRSPRPQLSEGSMEVVAYFTCDAAAGVPLRPVYRAVPKSPAVLRTALEVLVAGPTAQEREASLISFFSDATAGSLRSVTIANGHAVVDFDDLRPVIPNASSSAGSEMLLSQLDATVFQFRTVESVEYRLEGSCTDFSEWLQFGGCEPRTRPASQD